MGNKISNVTAIAGIDSYVSELSDVYYERSIGNARFMKTIRGRQRDSLVIVKIFVKPDPSMSLKSHVKRLQDEYDLLLDVPNAFPFQRLLETEKAAYLVRQYFYSSLYDRISTRPFLAQIEKKWISYQILRGVADAHAKQVYHGDIKTENVLVTSWNWVFLVDFASYKPTYLPEDDPADFSFFFDTSLRRSCYVAPERFYQAGTEIDQRIRKLEWNDQKSELTPEMDIFSVGCVIAELFLEGTSIFSLSQLFKYKSGEYSPDATLDKIEDEPIRSLIRHMIQLDPKSRFSAEEYLAEWRGKAFPDYFYTFLHQYMSTVTDKSDHMQQNSGASRRDKQQHDLSSFLPNSDGINKRLNDADDKIEQIYHDFDKIAYSVTNNQDINSTGRSAPGQRRRTLSDLPNTTASAIILPPTLNIPNYESNGTTGRRDSVASTGGESGTLIFLSYVCSLIRNTSFPSSKMKALDVLLALCEHLPDDVKLDRLVPYIMALLSDEAALVRANAIKTLTQVLCMVESISPINARIFPEYILPSVQEFAKDPDILVRTTYASCIALLAETALRFLEMTQLLKKDSGFSVTEMDAEDFDFESVYDASLQDLKSVIQEQVTILLIDPESSVKRALLTNITCLCVFFGKQKANDVLLSHMITYLNDKDWMLRSAFFESIKGVGTCVGAKSLEEYILPLMVQALTDAEEFVVEKVLNSLASLAELDLIQHMKIWELVGTIAPLMCHPSAWIRYGAIGFIASACRHMSQADLWCIIYPLLTPFLKCEVAEINAANLQENVKTPLPRQIYEQAINWATRASPRSTFWKFQQENNHSPSSTTSSPKSAGPGLLIRQGSLVSSAVIGQRVTRSHEDEGYLERLRNMGMSSEDEEKLMYLREYLLKVSRSKLSRPKSAEELTSGEVYLKNLQVTPMTVFLPDLSSETQLTEMNTRSPTPTSLPEKPKVLHTPSKQEVFKLNRVASEPHVQAILPSMAGRSSTEDTNYVSSSPVDITPRNTRQSASAVQAANTTQSPIPSPTDYTFEHRSLERAEISRNQEVDNAIASHLPNPRVGYGHLQNLLLKIARETFPPHVPEFTGDPAIMRRIRRLPQGTSPFRTINNWKPEGNLVAHFAEHTAGVNQLAISWDNLLFASCADDGSIKVWDCSRLERNVTNRSRATYNQQGGRIKCITFIEQTYSIAAASDNGSIHVFRVDIRSAGSALKFGKCITVRTYQLEGEYAVTIQHFTSNASNTMAGSKSILLFATTKGNIYAMDLITMQILWKLQNPVSHGVITCILTDRLHTWLLVGTTRGILTLYDLRFRISLRSWLHYTKSRINALYLNRDPRAEGRQVVIAAGKNEVSVWDIVQLKCVEVLAVKSGDDKQFNVQTELYKALDAPNDFDILSATFTADEANVSENSVRAVTSSSDCRFLITGGTDRKLRFWDMVRAENSCVVLGLDADELKPRYSATMYDKIKFHFEFANLHRRPPSSTGSIHRTVFGNGHSVHPGNGATAMQQQLLMRNHMDAITDIVLTEVPYPMIISGDRDGVIKVIA